MRQVLLGLVFLFHVGIQHRDIKPANILITGHGEVTDYSIVEYEHACVYLITFIDLSLNLSVRIGQNLGLWIEQGR